MSIEQQRPEDQHALGRGQLTAAVAVLALALLLLEAQLGYAHSSTFTALSLLGAALAGAAIARARTERALAELRSEGTLPASPFPQPGLEQLQQELQSARHSAQESRDRSTRISAQHDLITNNIAAAVTIRDLHGCTVFCSPYTLVLTGYSPEEICDQDGDFFRHIVVEEDLPRYDRAQQVSALAEDISVKYRIRHRSGLTIWLETRLVPVLDEEGELAAIMSVSIDVTDMLSYQRQIEEQNRDLSDFASMVSHDLKAPVFTIKGMAAALLEDYGTALGEDGRGLLQYVVDATLRLEGLIGSVLEYSSISVKETAQHRIELNEVVTTVLSDFGEMIKKKQAAIVVEDALPAITGNPVRIYQVFSNLVGNALKYSSPERKPEITIRRRASSGPSVIIEIADNGMGIAPKKLGDIFRPYHRAHTGSIEGSGIGLACVKKIMDMLGGSVTVTSREGTGSVFTLAFPVPDPAPRAIPADLRRCFEQ